MQVIKLSRCHVLAALVFTLEGVDPGLAQRGLLEVRRELRLAVPEAPSALLTLAGLYARAGESERARAAFEQYRREGRLPLH